MLHAIEGRATLLLAAHGFAGLADDPGPPVSEFGEFLRANQAWVAEVDGRTAGYAVAGPVGDALWIKQLSVDPEAGRRGVGSALLDHLIKTAKARAFRLVALSTFREVPFNAPFYARRGFRILPLEGAPRALAERFGIECPPGVDPATRTLMTRAP